MKLSQSNPFLSAARDVDTALFISAKTSSAIEGIRKPFACPDSLDRFKDFDTFEAYWKHRTAAKQR